MENGNFLQTWFKIKVLLPAGPNKRVGWKIGQNQIIINHVGLNNRVGWKNAENAG